MMNTYPPQKAHVLPWIPTLFMLAAAIPLGTAAADEPESWVDRDLFPEAYGILTSDRLIFPDNVSDLPIKLDADRQLFVDDYLIASMEGLSRELHQPTKYPNNPLMPGAVRAVWYEEQTGMYGMYKRGQYLESKDGVVWTPPAPEGAENQVDIPPHAGIAGFMRNPDLDNHEQRYQAVFFRYGNAETGCEGGFFLYHSEDGRRWKPSLDRPILKQTVAALDPGPFSAWGFGDTTTIRYDSRLKRYLCDGKFNLFMSQDTFNRLGIIQELKPRIRLRTLSESEDLIHWTPPRFYLFPDRYDPPDRQMYAHVGFVYESMWIGMLHAMRLSEGGWKQVDLQLTHSRDGRHWSRPRLRQPFIPVGGPDSWEADYLGIATTGPMLIGDELWFYYYGARSANRDKSAHWTFHSGLARLRRDGFASLNAGENPGQLLTRPLSFTGRSLFINAEVAEGGWVRAAVLSREGQVLDGYRLEDAQPIATDTIRGRITWKGADELSPPDNDHLRLRFELKNAKLYSFWIE